MTNYDGDMKRPVLEIEKEALDQFLELAAFVAILLLWTLSLYYYSKLPETIPTHFNFKGEVDDYGSKDVLWFLPVLGTVIFAVLTIINRFPHQFNYLVTINDENAPFQYALAQRLIRYLKLLIPVIFTCILMMMVWNVQGVDKNLAIWFLPVVLLAVFVPVGRYIYQSTR